MQGIKKMTDQTIIDDAKEAGAAIFGKEINSVMIATFTKVINHPLIMAIITRLTFA